LCLGLLRHDLRREFARSTTIPEALLGTGVEPLPSSRRLPGASRRSLLPST
jgi:hypothetical protein